MTWRMPAETALQDRVWMAFPRAGFTRGADQASADEARRTRAEVANLAVEFEPVSMVVDLPLQPRCATTRVSWTGAT